MATASSESSSRTPSATVSGGSSSRISSRTVSSTSVSAVKSKSAPISSIRRGRSSGSSASITVADIGLVQVADKLAQLRRVARPRSPARPARQSPRAAPRPARATRRAPPPRSCPFRRSCRACRRTGRIVLGLYAGVPDEAIANGVKLTRCEFRTSARSTRAEPTADGMARMTSARYSLAAGPVAGGVDRVSRHPPRLRSSRRCCRARPTTRADADEFKPGNLPHVLTSTARSSAPCGST